MKGRFLNSVIGSLLYISLLIASVATGAHFVLGHVTDLGTSSSALVKDFGAKKSTIVPMLIDQVVKNADAKEAKTINQNRAQITKALNDLLDNPKFSDALSKTLEPVGAALAAGQESVQLDTTVLVKTISDEVNKVAGKTVISPKDLKSISKPQPLDLKQPAKIFKTVKNIIDLLMLFWILALLLLIILFIRKREAAFKLLGKFFLALGVPVLVIWFVIPTILVHFANSNVDSNLPGTLLPIAFKEVTGFTEIMGIGFTALGVIFLVAAKMTAKKSRGSNVHGPLLKAESNVEGDLRSS